MSSMSPVDPGGARNRLEALRGREYWRSLAELAESGGLAPDAPAPDPRETNPLLPGAFDRRDFLKLMGASMALAGLGACARQPLEEILPYVRAPEEIVPGRPLFFATATTLSGVGIGVLAESHMGRPTKLEGNPGHPASRGASSALTQATVLSLYDPDRSQTVNTARIS